MHSRPAPHCLSAEHESPRPLLRQVFFPTPAIPCRSSARPRNRGFLALADAVGVARAAEALRIARAGTVEHDRALGHAASRRLSLADGGRAALIVGAAVVVLGSQAHASILACAEQSPLVAVRFAAAVIVAAALTNPIRVARARHALGVLDAICAHRHRGLEDAFAHRLALALHAGIALSVAAARFFFGAQRDAAVAADRQGALIAKLALVAVGVLLALILVGDRVTPRDDPRVNPIAPARPDSESHMM